MVFVVLVLNSRKYIIRYDDASRIPKSTRLILPTDLTVRGQARQKQLIDLRLTRLFPANPSTEPKIILPSHRC